MATVMTCRIVQSNTMQFSSFMTILVEKYKITVVNDLYNNCINGYQNLNLIFIQKCIRPIGVRDNVKLVIPPFSRHC